MKPEKLKSERMLNAKKKWNNEDVAHAISRRTGLTVGCARMVIDSLSEVMADKLKGNGEIHLSGIGKFFVKLWKQREVNHFGVKVQVPERARISFKPCADIENDIKFNTDGHAYQKAAPTNPEDNYSLRSAEELEAINDEIHELRNAKLERIKKLRGQLLILKGYAVQLPEDSPDRRRALYHVRDIRFKLEGRIPKFEESWVTETERQLDLLKSKIVN